MACLACFGEVIGSLIKIKAVKSNEPAQSSMTIDIKIESTRGNKIAKIVHITINPTAGYSLFLFWIKRYKNAPKRASNEVVPIAPANVPDNKSKTVNEFKVMASPKRNESKRATPEPKLSSTPANHVVVIDFSKYEKMYCGKNMLIAQNPTHAGTKGACKAPPKGSLATKIAIMHAITPI